MRFGCTLHDGCCSSSLIVEGTGDDLEQPLENEGEEIGDASKAGLTTAPSGEEMHLMRSKVRKCEREFG